VVVVAHFLCDAFSFLLTEDDTVTPKDVSDLTGEEYVPVDSLVFIECTSILSDHIQFNAQCTERLASDTVRMTSRNNIRTRLMNCTVDYKPRGINSMHVPSLTDFSLLVNENEIRYSEMPERLKDRVDPEVIGENGVTHGNVACTTFVSVTLSAQPTECLSMSASW